MTADKRITEELTMAYEQMTPEQISEKLADIEVPRLDADSEQRIKMMISGRIKQTDAQSGAGKSSVIKPEFNRWAAVAASVLILLSVAALNSETVMAAMARWFGFIPGVGVVDVENGADDLYVLSGTDITASDDMIDVTLNNALANGNSLELRYTVYLSQISDADMEKFCSNPSELYCRLGYDEYFAVAQESPRLTPYSETTVNGIMLTPVSTVVTETESLESIRTICISQSYELAGINPDDPLAGSLDIGGVKIAFGMNRIVPDDTVEGASGGAVAEIGGVKMLCVPSVRNNCLYVDYYVYDRGGYSSVTGCRGFGNKTDILTLGGQEIDGFIDEGYVFDNSGGSHVGYRIGYDIADYAGENVQAVINISGIFVKKEYKGRGLYFDRSPEAQQTLGEVVELDGISVDVAEICWADLGEADGYEETDYGYLVLRYKADSNDDIRFVRFSGISINGEYVESFYMNDYDGVYKNILIPLSVPYADIRSMEFESAELMLRGDIRFEFPVNLN